MCLQLNWWLELRLGLIQFLDVIESNCHGQLELVNSSTCINLINTFKFVKINWEPHLTHVSSTIHHQHNGHFISTKFLWSGRAVVGFQAFKRKLHTHILLDQVKVEFTSCLKKKKLCQSMYIISILNAKAQQVMYFVLFSLNLSLNFGSLSFLGGLVPLKQSLISFFNTHSFRTHKLLHHYQFRTHKLLHQIILINSLKKEIHT